LIVKVPLEELDASDATPLHPEESAAVNVPV
jgi:hypothetical protein